MDNESIVDEWISLADIDLESAKYLLSMKPQPMEIICYHCQQSAEKYLKGYIAYCGGKVLKTHDLVVLNKQCVHFEELFYSIQDYCFNLTDYGVQVRYPFHIDLEEQDVNLAILSAEKIKQFIMERLCR